MKKLSLLLFLIVSVIVTQAQNTIVRSMGSANDEYSYGVDNTLDGGYIIVGYTESQSVGKEDVLLTKTNGLGEVEWSKVYGGAENESGWGVVATKDGGYVVVGNTNSYANNKARGLVFKTDKSGKVLWDYIVDNDTAVDCYNVMESRTGSLYLTGLTYGDSTGADMYIAKIFANGNFAWMKSFGDRGTEEGYSLTEDAKGNIVAVGVTDFDSTTAGGRMGQYGDQDVMLVSVDTAGKVRYQKSIGSTERETAWDIQHLNNKIFLTGWYRVPGSSFDAPFMMQVDTAGKLVSGVPVSTMNNSKAFNLAFDYLGSPVITGYTYDTITKIRDVFSITFGANNTVSYSNAYGGILKDGHWPTDIVRATDQGMMILSTTESFGTSGSQNFYLIKTDNSAFTECHNKVMQVDPFGLMYSENDFGNDTLKGLIKPINLSDVSMNLKDSTYCCKLKAVAASDSVAICIGNRTNLGGPSLNGVSYSWTSIEGEAFSSNLPNPSVSPKENTTYRLVVSSDDKMCANDTAYIKVKINPVTITNGTFLNDTVFCERDSVVLSAPNNLSAYFWTSRTVNTNTKNVKFKKADTAYLEVLDNFGCSYFDTSIVVENPYPRIGLPKDTAVCANEFAVLKGPENMAAYNWNNGDSDSMYYITIEEKNHILIVTDSNGCMNSDTMLLLTQPASPFSLGPDNGFCLNDSFLIIGPGALDDFVWNGVPSQSPNFWAKQPGTYTLQAANSFGCVTADTIELVTFDLPVYSLGGDTGFCEGGSILLSGPAGMADYLWFNGSPDQTLTATGSGNYHLTVTNNNGCRYTDTIEITEFDLPVVDLGNDTVIFDTDSLQLDAGAGYSSYLWSTNETSQMIWALPSEAGQPATVYSVVVTDGNGCEGTDELELGGKINSVEKLQLNGFKLYPNPTTDILNVTFDNPEGKNYSFEVVSMQGQILRTGHLNNIAGKSTLEFNATALANGIYTLHIIDEVGNSTAFKFNRIGK